MRISGGGNFLSPRNEGLENGTAKPCHSEARSAVRIALPQPLADMNFSEGSIQTLTTMRSSRRFAPQDDMILNDSSLRKAAFTLAEVLITLGIIGIVAAMTLPTLNQAINNKVRAEQVRTVKYKFTKATEKMNSLGLIGPYASTDAFVDELQKHLKIMKRCDSSHLRECWPYDEINTTNGAIAVSSLTNGSSLMMRTTDDKDFSSPNVGIVTADGVPMILNYNKKCNALDPVKQYQWSTSDGKPVSNATAGCVAAVFEINGGAKPNKYKDDVIAFNSNGLNNECAVGTGLNGICLSAPFSPTPMTKAECEAQKSTLGIKECCSAPWGDENDYWAGAVLQCGGVSKMPSMAQLGELASQMYVGNPSIGAKEDANVKFDSNSSTVKALGLTLSPRIDIWSGEEFRSCGTYYRAFMNTRTEFGKNDYSRLSSYFTAVCIVN